MHANLLADPHILARILIYTCIVFMYPFEWKDKQLNINY